MISSGSAGTMSDAAASDTWFEAFITSRDADGMADVLAMGADAFAGTATAAAATGDSSATACAVAAADVIAIAVSVTTGRTAANWDVLNC